MDIDIIKFAHLIAKLAYDDDFRASFSADPRKVLEEMGIALDAFSLPAPGEPFTLASKEILQKEYEDRLAGMISPSSGPHYALIDHKI